MASSALFRCLSRGGPSLLRSQACRSSITTLLKNDSISRTYKLTPAACGNSWNVPDYFRARRGPFTPEEKQGNHMMFASTHWKIERILAVSMLGIMPAALFVQGPTMDFVFTSTVFLHAFWAFDHVLSDYLVKFFPYVKQIWYIVSIIAFAGLMNFNFNDVGITKAIAMLWSL